MEEIVICNFRLGTPCVIDMMEADMIPGSCLLISSLPGSALRMHVESLGKPRDVNKRS